MTREEWLAQPDSGPSAAPPAAPATAPAAAPLTREQWLAQPDEVSPEPAAPGASPMKQIDTGSPLADQALGLAAAALRMPFGIASLPHLGATALGLPDAWTPRDYAPDITPGALDYSANPEGSTAQNLIENIGGPAALAAAATLAGKGLSMVPAVGLPGVIAKGLGYGLQALGGGLGVRSAAEAAPALLEAPSLAARGLSALKEASTAGKTAGAIGGAAMAGADLPSLLGYDSPQAQAIGALLGGAVVGHATAPPVSAGEAAGGAAASARLLNYLRQNSDDPAAFDAKLAALSPADLASGKALPQLLNDPKLATLAEAYGKFNQPGADNVTMPSTGTPVASTFKNARDESDTAQRTARMGQVADAVPHDPSATPADLGGALKSSVDNLTANIEAKAAPTADLATHGAALREALNAAVEAPANQARNLYGRLSRDENGNILAQTTLENVAAAKQQLMQDTTLQGLNTGPYEPPITGEAKTWFDKIPSVADAAAPVPLDTVLALRTQLGRQIAIARNGAGRGDSAAAENLYHLGPLYAALSQDMERAPTGASGMPGDAAILQQAQALWKQHRDLAALPGIKDVLATDGRNNPKVSDANVVTKIIQPGVNGAQTTSVARDVLAHSGVDQTPLWDAMIAHARQADDPGAWIDRHNDAMHQAPQGLQQWMVDRANAAEHAQALAPWTAQGAVPEVLVNNMLNGNKTAEAAHLQAALNNLPPGAQTAARNTLHQMISENLQKRINKTGGRSEADALLKPAKGGVLPALGLETGSLQKMHADAERRALLDKEVDTRIKGSPTAEKLQEIAENERKAAGPPPGPIRRAIQHMAGSAPMVLGLHYGPLAGAGAAALEGILDRRPSPSGLIPHAQVHHLLLNPSEIPAQQAAAARGGLGLLRRATAPSSLPYTVQGGLGAARAARFGSGGG